MKHAAIIPLAGGAVIGAAQALGRPPEFMASWTPFAKNDAYARDYFPDVPFHTFHENIILNYPKVDIITCVPPCSGLSTATPSTARGCQAPQNEHMLKVADAAMKWGTQTVIIENAHTLYTKGGEEFANRFVKYTKKYGYSMVLYKTSTILHGLPQNRVRSFVLLFKGNMIPRPENMWVRKRYKPMYEWPRVDSPMSKNWVLGDDELINVLEKHKYLNWLKTQYHILPTTAWNIFNKMGIRYRFKTAPYRYMQDKSSKGLGIMDRSPYIVYDHSNALMWKSAHKMFNPWSKGEQYNIRELMNFMGMPRNYKEIPAKDINVLFQNVPVNTVRTLIETIYEPYSWVKATQPITRYNNINQTVEVW